MQEKLEYNFSVYFLLFPYPKNFSQFFSSHWKKILEFRNMLEKLEKTNSDKKMYHTHTVTGWIYCRQAWGGQELRNYIAIHDIWSLNLFLRCRCKMNGYANLISRKYSAPKINFHSIRHESWIALATLGEIRQGNTEHSGLY